MELLQYSTNCETNTDRFIIVYDQCTSDPSALPVDCFAYVLVSKLNNLFKKVGFLKGGFLDFKASYPSLCESKTSNALGSDVKPTLTSMSQPCMPISTQGPTKILPFLYLGSQNDALSKKLFDQQKITHVLNVSTQCPQPEHVIDAYFFRIAINDNYTSKLLPHLDKAFSFINKVKEANGKVLVHCMAGISRSPALAIAYIMKFLNMSSDDAYKFVKEKRPTISPNFNFLGQLTEYEKILKNDGPPVPPKLLPIQHQASTNLHSPTTAFSLLSFSDTEVPMPKHALPASSLRNIQFTSCSKLPSKAGVRRPLSLNVETESLAFRGVSASSCPKPAVKRPLSLGVDTPSLSSSKRPTVRPSSIVLSGTPLSPQKEESPPANYSSEISERRCRSFDNLFADNEDNDDLTGGCSFRRKHPMYSSIGGGSVQSNSSPISSAGSSSLHGSRELISVT